MIEVSPDPDGILPVDKPVGMVSHVVVATLRRKFGFLKVGHGGTLDPDASGLLLILLGKGTKMSDRVMGGDKKYIGTIRFGAATTTQDRLGEITESHSTEGLTEAAVTEAMKAFTGDVFQTPPMYSAVKIDGQPLYKMAVRGEECEREQRFIHVYSFRVTAFRPSAERAEADFEVRSTKGTYVRTLAHDLGQALGVSAHLCALRRVQSGIVNIERATSFAELLEMSRADLVARTIPCAQYLSGKL
ncbi:MAG: tRNA pseudouridine(55) synthase TruB [Kiritimatiellia bacterium]